MELVAHILSFVTDRKTYLSCSCVCSAFRWCLVSTHAKQRWHKEYIAAIERMQAELEEFHNDVLNKSKAPHTLLTRFAGAEQRLRKKSIRIQTAEVGGDFGDFLGSAVTGEQKAEINEAQQQKRCPNFLNEAISNPGGRCFRKHIKDEREGHMRYRGLLLHYRDNTLTGVIIEAECYDNDVQN